MLTGAIASSYYGRPRTTLDMDVVIAIAQADISKLVKTLEHASLRVQERKLIDAWKSQKNPIATLEDRKSPHTLDIIFTDRKLERRPGRILGMRTYYQTAESLILAKLRMLKVTLQSEKAAVDREDIKAILKTSPISLRSLRSKAREQSTLKILDNLLLGKTD
jgi:hypothetical protein